MSNQFPRFPGAMSRRSLLFGLTGAGALVLMGCAQSGDEANASAVQGKPGATADTTNSAAGSASMTLFKDPNCGCCGSWAELAREAGYGVTVRNDQDMTAVKRRLGVPEDLASCHTTQVAGYVVEGHVPLRRWLACSVSALQASRGLRFRACRPARQEWKCRTALANPTRSSHSSRTGGQGSSSR